MVVIIASLPIVGLTFIFDTEEALLSLMTRRPWFVDLLEESCLWLELLSDKSAPSER